MALGDFARRLLGARQPQQGEPSSPEPVPTGAQSCQPVPTTEEDCPPYIFGSLRSARKHAERLRDEMVEAGGLVNRAIWQGELERCHLEMCERLGWVLRLWDAVGRELAKLPGVKRGMVKLDGQRLTTYEVREAAAMADGAEPAKPAAEVDLAERKRA